MSSFAPIAAPSGPQSVVTPSGIALTFEEEPKRRYTVNGEDAASVTTILGCLDKPALVWWGMKVGVEGVYSLFRNEHIPWDRAVVVQSEPEDWVRLLTEQRLTVNHVRDKGADRGKSVHSALERYILSGRLPDPADYPAEEQGYVAGLVRFLDHAKLEPVASEVMVGSAEHGFAGRYDLDARISSPVVLDGRVFRGKTRAVGIDVGLYKFDLKTSKGIYDTHHLQLSGYELAAVECGYSPTDGQVVVCVSADGTYEVAVNRSTPEQFLAILRCYEAMQALKAALK